MSAAEEARAAVAAAAEKDGHAYGAAIVSMSVRDGARWLQVANECDAMATAPGLGDDARAAWRLAAWRCVEAWQSGASTAAPKTDADPPMTRADPDYIDKHGAAAFYACRPGDIPIATDAPPIASPDLLDPRRPWTYQDELARLAEVKAMRARPGPVAEAGRALMGIGVADDADQIRSNVAPSLPDAARALADIDALIAEAQAAADRVRTALATMTRTGGTWAAWMGPGYEPHKWPTWLIPGAKVGRRGEVYEVVVADSVNDIVRTKGVGDGTYDLRGFLAAGYRRYVEPPSEGASEAPSEPEAAKG